MKCFTTWQHNYLTLVYITELGSTIQQAIQHILLTHAFFGCGNLLFFLSSIFKLFFFKMFRFPFTVYKKTRKSEG